MPKMVSLAFFVSSEFVNFYTFICISLAFFFIRAGSTVHLQRCHKSALFLQPVIKGTTKITCFYGPSSKETTKIPCFYSPLSKVPQKYLVFTVRHQRYNKNTLFLHSVIKGTTKMPCFYSPSSKVPQKCSQYF